MPALTEGNRVLLSITKAEGMIEQALAIGRTNPEKLADLNRAFDMECMEFCRFQEIKTLAVAEGKLSLVEGETIYHLLGESPDTFNNQPLATKIALTELFKALLEGRIKAHRRDLTPESLRKRGFPPAVIDAVFAWIQAEGDPAEERHTFQSVLVAKKAYGLAWWDVERAVRYAVEEGLDLHEPDVWLSIVERLELRPEDVLTLPLFGRRRRR